MNRNPDFCFRRFLFGWWILRPDFIRQPLDHLFFQINVKGKRADKGEKLERISFPRVFHVREDFTGLSEFFLYILF